MISPKTVASWRLALVFLFLPVSSHAWIWRAPSGPTGGNTIFGAAYSPELDTVLAVDIGGSVLRKAGNGPWTAVKVPGLIGFESAHWTGQHFIISGEDADDNWHGISTDGVSWTPIAKLDDNGLDGFASSPTVTVALDGRTVLVSSDPRRSVWVEKKLPLVRDSYGRPGYFDYIAYGNGTFMVVTYEGLVATSADGVNWASSPAAKYDGYVNELFFQNGLFVTGGWGSNSYEIRTSTDGKQWSFAELPRNFNLRKILPFGSGFLVLGYDEWNWNFVSYTTSDFLNWQQTNLAGADLSNWGWVQAMTPDKNGGAYFFGSGGRIGRFSPPGSLQMVADPGGLSGDPCGGDGFGFFRYLAAIGSMLFGSDEYGNGAYYLGPGGRWTEFSTALDHPAKPWPDSFHQLSDGVVAVTSGSPSAGLYIYRNNRWDLLGPAPRIDRDWSIVSVARSPQGRAVVLARSGWEEAPSNEQQRDYKFYVSDDWQQWQASAFAYRGRYYGGPVWTGAEDVVRHDGRRFLAVIEPGRMFQSDDGSNWTPLPLIPDDTVAFRKIHYGSKSDVPLANDPRAFASNGDLMVVAAGKGWDRALEQFFVYSFASRTWAAVVPPGARRSSVHPPIVRWSGSVFLAAVRDGTCLSADYGGSYIYTSPNGYDWTKREFPVGGNLLDVLWTGTEFAAVTYGSSVLTHPTGLSQPILAPGPPPQADQITLAKIAPKVFGAAPFALQAKARSGRALSYASSNGNVAAVNGGVVEIKGVGTTVITATIAGDSSVPAATQQLVVSPLQQKFSIRAKPAQRINVPFDLGVTSNSDRPLAFTSTPSGAITVVETNGRYLATATATGKLKLTATQSGDANRLAAKPVSKSFTVK